MIGVPVDEEDDSNALAEFVEETGAVYELNGGWTSARMGAFKDIVWEQLRTEALPATVITDSEGQVLRVLTGVPTRSEIAKLLAE